MKSYLSILFLLSMVAWSCSTTNSTSVNHRDNMNSTGDAIEDPSETIDLTTHLQRFPGINVEGNRANAKITVRGVGSFYSDTTPLFILDGVPLSQYGDLYNSVTPNMIRRIQVLKRPEEIGLYGVRGANGVIKVTTKKAGDS